MLSPRASSVGGNPVVGHTGVDDFDRARHSEWYESNRLK